MKEFITGKVRIQLLSRDIIRLELRGKDGFCDDDTYFVPHRDFAGCDGDARVVDGMLTVTAGELSIAVPENAQSLKGARLTRGDDAWSYTRTAWRLCSTTTPSPWTARARRWTGER